MSIPASQVEHLTIRALKAVDEPHTCAEFLRQHRKVLEDFGIEHVNTNNDTWTTDPDTYLIIAESATHGMVGGLRIEQVKTGRRMPIVDALEKIDGRIEQAMMRWSAEGCAEICGLWNSSRFANRGLPTLLGYAAVAIANQIHARSMVCLIAHYTLRHALKVGFTIMDDVGDGGTFTYPIPSIKAIAMVMPDTILLTEASDKHRLPVLSLRMRPVQQRLEQPGSELLLVDYNLQLDTKVIDISAFKEVLEYRLRFSA